MGFKAGELLLREGIVLSFLLLQMGGPCQASSSMSHEPRLHWHFAVPGPREMLGYRFRVGWRGERWSRASKAGDLAEGGWGGG